MKARIAEVDSCEASSDTHGESDLQKVRFADIPVYSFRSGKVRCEHGVYGLMGETECDENPVRMLLTGSIDLPPINRLHSSGWIPP